MSERIELVGLREQGWIAHLNCPAGEGGAVGDVGADGSDVAYCSTCELEFPTEVCESFEDMEDGRETEEKPFAHGGYDPPLWQFDGVEWRMS